MLGAAHLSTLAPLAPDTPRADFPARPRQKKRENETEVWFFVIYVILVMVCAWIFTLHTENQFCFPSILLHHGSSSSQFDKNIEGIAKLFLLSANMYLLLRRKQYNNRMTLAIQIRRNIQEIEGRNYSLQIQSVQACVGIPGNGEPFKWLSWCML